MAFVNVWRRCMSAKRIPAQRLFAERFISWDRVQERLARYGAIGRAFPIGLLERHRVSPPYFCHYMAWRLGVWHNEALFERLEELLRCAESLPGWESERPLLESAEYADYWSLVWQLQISEHLYSVGSDVRWCGSGPDLSARFDGKEVFVECYSYRKSFPTRIFLEDIFAQLGDDIKLDHDWFMPFSLPSNQKRSEFLDRTLSPFLDEANMDRLRADARRRYPVKVIEPASSLVIYLEGPIEAYDPNIRQRNTSDPEAYIELILREAVSSKAESNQLRTHRPNVLAVSYLLSTEAQVAFDLREKRGPVNLGDSIDALAVSAAGIDEKLSREKLSLVSQGVQPNPALRLIAHSL